jgi:cytoskeleton protein RodZ
MVETRIETALGLGERLRSARKARALSVEQAAAILRLEDTVLLALEDERFETLGAPVFVRGHLRAYARLLGLAEEQVLSAYRAADPAADRPPALARDREKPLSESPGPLAIAVGVGLAVLVMLAIYVFGGEDASVAPTTPSQTVPAAPENTMESTAETTTITQPVFESPPPLVAPAPEPAADSTPPPADPVPPTDAPATFE